MGLSYELVVVEGDSGGLCLHVGGEIDLVVAPELLDSILCAGLMSGCHAVSVDLSAVRFIDVSGLGALLEAHRRLHRDGCRLEVVGMPEQVRRLVEAAGLTRSFGLHLFVRPAAAQSEGDQSLV